MQKRLYQSSCSLLPHDSLESTFRRRRASILPSPLNQPFSVSITSRPTPITIIIITMKLSLLRKSKIMTRTKPVPVLAAGGVESESTPHHPSPSVEQKGKGKFSKLFKSKSKPSKKVTSEVDEVS
jgi:hypothetical protein